MATDRKKMETILSQERVAKAAEGILFLLAGQVSIGLVVLLLFAFSFLASPLRPLVWAQLAAVVVLVIGGVFLVAVIVVRYRKELARFLSRK